MFSKIIQGNARFGLTDRLEVHLDHVRIPAGNEKLAEKIKWRSLDVLFGIVFLQCIDAVKEAFVFCSRTNYCDSSS